MDRLYFLDSIQDYEVTKHAGRVIHILCTEGNMSFTFQDVRYNVVPCDYVIVTNPVLASDFSASDDFDAVIMSLSETFVTSMAIQSNYGIIGHLSLLRNPVMKLSQHDYRICLEDLWKLCERLDETHHLFREEMLGHLLLVHIFDLYDIHARGRKDLQVSEHTASLMRQFIELLYKGEYIHHRDVPYYASRLCITPHYLSEICKKTSGKPASYWIDRFRLHDIINLLCQKELPLTEISNRMNFSSVSYFSRYVRKRTGVYPTEYRNRLIENSL